MIVITSKYLVPKGYTAMAVFPFILLREKQLTDNEVMMNHEKIHLRQQAELLVIPFYIWYGLEYLFNLAKHGSHATAYRNISFEREAYANEANPNYLKNRMLWNFTKFL